MFVTRVVTQGLKLTSEECNTLIQALFDRHDMLGGRSSVPGTTADQDKAASLEATLCFRIQRLVEDFRMRELFDSTDTRGLELSAEETTIAVEALLARYEWAKQNACHPQRWPERAKEDVREGAFCKRALQLIDEAWLRGVNEMNAGITASLASDPPRVRWVPASEISSKSLRASDYVKKEEK